MNNDKLINKLIDINLDLCYNDSAFNDEFIHDLLRYGFKGFENMTPSELAAELEQLK
mgnify:CR=1 FL=1|jgi:hypothetical protein